MSRVYILKVHIFEMFLSPQNFMPQA